MLSQRTPINHTRSCWILRMRLRCQHSEGLPLAKGGKEDEGVVVMAVVVVAAMLAVVARVVVMAAVTATVPVMGHRLQ